MQPKDKGYETKVAAPAGKPTIGKTPSHPMVGSKGPGSGSPVKTTKSQPITGKLGNGMTSMGTGAIINGKV